MNEPRPGVTRLASFPAERILHLTKYNTPFRDFNINGTTYKVCMHSTRFKLFRKSKVCACCGLEGQHMILDLHRGHTRPHFNLYGVRNGKLVLFTRDHILPKSKGGENSLTNYQTMCERCNKLKRNKNITVEELRKRIAGDKKKRTNKKKRTANLKTKWADQLVAALLAPSPSSETQNPPTETKASTPLEQ